MAEAASTRIEKVNKLLKQKVGEFILREVELPSDCFATINRVRTTRDLKSAEVFISVLPDDHKEKIISILERNLPKIQADLADYLEMKSTPKLVLKIDDQAQRANEIENLLDEIGNGP